MVTAIDVLERAERFGLRFSIDGAALRAHGLPSIPVDLFDEIGSNKTGIIRELRHRTNASRKLTDSGRLCSSCLTLDLCYPLPGDRYICVRCSITVTPSTITRGGG